MRIKLALALSLSLLASACGSKKAAQSPANAAPAAKESTSTDGTGATEMNKKTDGKSEGAPSGGGAADPCAGGE